VTIVGGGLAGLSLGVALAERGVPVALHEAGDLPRHRVCGEFICGVAPSTLERLAIADDFTDAEVNRSGRWNGPDGRTIFEFGLPVPALGISRYRLDFRLMQRLERAGGRVDLGSRWRGNPSAEGIVLASGRNAKRTSWMGFKVHVSGSFPEGLSLFLGDRGYVGLAPVEGGFWNMCGLFEKRPGIRGGKEEILGAYAAAAGIGAVSEILEEADIRGGSGAGVAGVSFTVEPLARGEVRIGDAWGVIPPFTGNGMSIAFESAEIALGPIQEWIEGRKNWNAVAAEIDRRHRARFLMRFRVANALHPWILKPVRRKLLAVLARTRLLPFRSLFALTR